MSRVVILDDDQHIRSLMCRLFEALGAEECRAYASVNELQKDEADIMLADLIVLDVNLGTNQPSGVDAHEWLLEKRFAGRMIFLTGHAQGHPLVRKATAVGSARVYEKPIPMDVLASILESATNEVHRTE